MQKILANILALWLITESVHADSIYPPPPSSTGTAATGQIPGVATNTAASTGNVGEFITSSVTPGTFTNNSQTNTAQATLTPGDWNVQCTFYYVPAASTTVTLLVGSISPTSATNNITSFFYGVLTYPTGSVLSQSNQGPSVTTPVAQILLSTSTTYYCVAYALFGLSTMAVTGVLTARRAR